MKRDINYILLLLVVLLALSLVIMTAYYRGEMNDALEKNIELEVELSAANSEVTNLKASERELNATASDMLEKAGNCDTKIEIIDDSALEIKNSIKNTSTDNIYENIDRIYDISEHIENESIRGALMTEVEDMEKNLRHVEGSLNTIYTRSEKIADVLSLDKGISDMPENKSSDTDNASLSETMVPKSSQTQVIG